MQENQDQKAALPVIRRRRKYTFNDLRRRDLELLGKAYGLNDEEFLCFGHSFYVLNSLGLISDEAQITHYGRQFLWELSRDEQAKKVKDEPTR